MRHVSKWLTLAIIVFSVICKTYSMFKIIVSHADGELESEISPLSSQFDLLVLVLTRTPKYALWTLFTTALIETRGIPFILTLVIVFTAGTCIENLYKQRAFLRFVALMTVGVTFAEVVYCLLFAEMPTMVCGSHGLVMGFIVALKQLVPGHIIVLFKNRLRIPVRSLSLLWLIFMNLLYLLNLEDNLLGYYLGFFMGWCYLRFFNQTDYVGRGDASDNFRFVAFFPQVIGKYMEPVVNLVYNLVLKTGINQFHFTQSEIDDANQRYNVRLSGTVLPVFGEARVTNERRKMMLKTMEHEI